MDISYLLFLQSLRDTTNHIWDKFFVYVTGYGEMAGLLPLFALIYWCINKKTGEFMFLSLALARLVNGFIKIAACVYRPWIRDPRVTPINNGLKTAKGYSFPSGHTTNATAAFGSLAVKQNKEDKFLKIILWGLAILVGFSRNYIGVHTPQDVLVGFLFSVIVVFASLKLFHILEKDKNADIKITIVGLIISSLIIIFSEYKTYPITYDFGNGSYSETTYLKIADVKNEIAQKALANPNAKILVNPKEMILDLYKNIGYIFGIFLGWIIERRCIKFTTDGTTGQKILRYLVCFILMEIMLQVICPLIKLYMDKVYSEPIIAFIKTFYILGIAPIFIKLMQKVK